MPGGQQADAGPSQPLHQLEPLLFSLSLRTSVFTIRSVSRSLNTALANAQDPQLVPVIAKMFYDINFVHPELDRIISLIARQDLNETFAVHLPQLRALVQRLVDAVQATPFREPESSPFRLLSVALFTAQRCSALDTSLIHLLSQEDQHAVTSSWSALLSVVRRLLKSFESETALLQGPSAPHLAAITAAVSSLTCLSEAYENLWAVLQPQLTSLSEPLVRSAIIQALSISTAAAAAAAAGDELSRWLAFAQSGTAEALSVLSSLAAEAETGSLVVTQAEPVSEDKTVWRTVPASYNREIELAVGLQERFENIKQQLAVQEQSCQQLSAQLSLQASKEQSLLQQLQHAQKVAAEKTTILKDSTAQWSKDRAALENSLEALQNDLIRLNEQCDTLRKQASAAGSGLAAIPRLLNTESSSSSSSSAQQQDAGSMVLHVDRSGLVSSLATQVSALQQAVTQLTLSQSTLRASLSPDILVRPPVEPSPPLPPAMADAVAALHKYHSQLSHARVIKVRSSGTQPSSLLPLPKRPLTSFFPSPAVDSNLIAIC